VGLEGRWILRSWNCDEEDNLISARNYAAQAVRGINLYADRTQHDPKYQADVPFVRGMVKDMFAAVHFVLPDDGKFLEDDLRGLHGLKARLPYPKLTLEYHSSTGCKVVILAAERRPEDVAAALNWKDELAFLPAYGDVVILLYYAFSIPAIPGEWYPSPKGIILPSEWEDQTMETPLGFKMRPFAFLPAACLQVLSDEKIRGKDAAWDGDVLRVTLCFLEALACSNVSTKVLEPVDPKVNRKREAKGKLPFYETKVLVVQAPKIAGQLNVATSDDGDKRASPREHLRRGHIRRIEDGRRVWVNSCIVGSRNLGHVGKRYMILGSEQDGPRA
jgi:hypothetical protein